MQSPTAASRRVQQLVRQLVAAPESDGIVDLDFFHTHGYVIIPNAVAPESVDALRDDIAVNT